ncbi:MAG: sulfatase [Anditalea sp.]
MKIYFFLGVLLAIGLVMGGFKNRQKPDGSQQPNIIILFTDDMGYGDLGCYGNPIIRTPNIDALAEQGMRFTSFVTGSWCVPSRTQLMTGRYMPRVKFGGGTGADGEGGLPESELTLAEGLKEAGYITGMAGKWHLGYKQKKFLPPNQGFDSWFGLPYSNDYIKPWVKTDEPLGYYRGTEMLEHPINQDSLTVRYTEEAVSFIKSNAGKSQPFFFYLAYNMPHLPIRTTQHFRGKSGAGLYGDVIQTIDWSVEQVLAALDEHGISDETIVFFASDNGPWMNMPERMQQAGNKPWHAGSPGPLRGSKATTYEGGTRVPAMIRWPGKILSKQVSDEMVASPDIYRTFLSLAGAEMPNHPIDGYDIMPFLQGQAEASPRKEYAYFLRDELQAMRIGDWKLRLANGDPELFNLQTDPAERYNRAAENPEIVKRIRKGMTQFAGEVGVKVSETK